jgi:TRAP-type mannitol/chloroaromatic compound transport system permease small subunit
LSSLDNGGLLLWIIATLILANICTVVIRSTSEICYNIVHIKIFMSLCIQKSVLNVCINVPIRS